MKAKLPHLTEFTGQSRGQNSLHGIKIVIFQEVNNFLYEQKAKIAKATVAAKFMPHSKCKTYSYQVGQAEMRDLAAKGDEVVIKMN